MYQCWQDLIQWTCSLQGGSLDVHTKKNGWEISIFIHRSVNLVCCVCHGWYSHMQAGFWYSFHVIIHTCQISLSIHNDVHIKIRFLLQVMYLARVSPCQKKNYNYMLLSITYFNVKIWVVWITWTFFNHTGSGFLRQCQHSIVFKLGCYSDIKDVICSKGVSDKVWPIELPPNWELVGTRVH